MYKHLYDNFKHWYHGGTVYFYSDPHFSDPEMKYLRKNYIGDEEQVKRINKVVGKNDTIIFLGDIGDIEFIRKIKGYKVLIQGNHDAGATNYQRRRNNETGEDNHLFDEVYEGPLMISEKILLSHEPIDLPFIFNIHGHDHSNMQYKDERHINMCAENINYTPVGIKEIINTCKIGSIDSIHRCTIDKATEKKRKRENDLFLKSRGL